MNDKKKKLTQVIVLSVLLLGLIGVTIFTISGGKDAMPQTPTPTAQNTETTPGNTTAAATAPPVEVAAATGGNVGTVEWVVEQEQRLDGMADEVTRGHDPFTNKFVKLSDLGTSATGSTATGSTGSTGSAIIPIDHEDLGPFPITETPVEPLVVPPPPFVLSGVVVTRMQKYATMTIEGNYYMLREGDSIPKYGWKVKTITPAYNTVVLTKDTQSVTLRLAGGSPK